MMTDDIILKFHSVKMKWHSASEMFLFIGRLVSVFIHLMKRLQFMAINLELSIFSFD